MPINLQETMHKESIAQEKQNQALLRAKDIKIYAQSNLIGAIQKRLSAIEKQLRGYSQGDLYSIAENHRQLLTLNKATNDAEKTMMNAQKREEAVIKVLTVNDTAENSTTDNNIPESASALAVDENPKRRSSVAISINGIYPSVSESERGDSVSGTMEDYFARCF